MGNAVDRNHVKRVAWLLAHGANPRTVHGYTKRNLHTCALLQGHSAIAELLAKAGAQPETLQGREAFQAACLQLDVETARTLAEQHPEYLHNGATLLTAARHGRADVIDLLLALGTSVNSEGANGERALHSAVWTDSVPIAKLLIERGAEVDALDGKFQGTALGWAIHLDKPQVADYLSTLSGDLFGLVKLGKLDRVRSLLTAEPSLAKMTPQGETSLFYLPDTDEDLAIEMAQLLLSYGVDTSLKNSAGRTAADEVERKGMDALAEMLRT
jgi:ankyrin repeat protein